MQKNIFQEYGYEVNNFNQFVKRLAYDYDVETDSIWGMLRGDETIDEVLEMVEDEFGGGSFYSDPIDDSGDY